MWRVWQMWGHVLIAAFVALPLAALTARHLAFRREKAGHPHPVRTAWLDVGLVVGTLPWLWMILTPAELTSEIHLVPFQDLADVLRAGPQTAVVQVGGNLLVFAALGALLPLRAPRFAGLVPVALVAAAGSAGVEILQHVLRLGRVSSVDDVLLNVAGAVAAALVTRGWWRRRNSVRVVSPFRPPKTH